MTDVHPVMLPKTGKHPVPTDVLPGGDPLVICPHEGPVVVSLPDKGALGQIKTVKCSERAIANVVIAGWHPANIYPGGQMTFESRRRLVSIFAEVLGARPRIKWVCVG